MKFPSSLFEIRSIRARIALGMIVPVLPVAAMVVWLLTEDLRHARDSARTEVRQLATVTADDLRRFLQRSGEAMQRIAARPRVRALDSAGCDPLLLEVEQLVPSLSNLGLRNAAGAVVCANPADPLARLPAAGVPWFTAALASNGLLASDAMVVGPSPRWISVLTYPVRDEAGRVVGVLTLPIDLVAASERWLATVPSTALVAVLDRQRTVLLRSADPAGFVGKQPRRHAVDPPDGQSEGFHQVTGDDGVTRLLAYVMLPGVEWRVIAARPGSEVFGDFDRTVLNAALVGLLVAFVGIWLGLRLSTSIARPMTGLAQTARAVARGDTRARAAVAGPGEVATVAEQFNLMLDARDAAEAALRESEERYRTVVDWSPEALSVHRGGYVLFVNRATVELIGAQTAEDLVGHRSIEVVHPAFREGLDDLVNTAFEQGLSIPRHEQRLVRRDGRDIDVEVQATRIVYNGKPALIASLRDITERKRTQAALQASEARLQAIFATAHDAILTADEEQNIVMANPAAAAMFRCPLERLVGAPLERLIPERFHESHRAEVTAFGQGEGGPRRMGGRHRAVTGRRVDGEEFAIDAAISRLEVDGRQLYTVILRDMTERRRFEATLRQREAQLQRLFAAQDRVQEEERRRIARELHDDLQQTLAAMRMNLKAVGERISADPRGAAALLAEVDQLAGAAIVSTRRIVNDLRPPILEDLGLVPALETLAAQFRQHSSIACEVRADDDAAADVEAPAVATSLFRVAQESLNNVLKHARATRVTMRLAAAPDDGVSLTIQDDGVGFEPAAARKPLSYGLLGMSERIRALGGVLRVGSRPGGGTTIEVTLPAQAADSGHGPEPTDGADLADGPRAAGRGTQRADA